MTTYSSTEIATEVRTARKDFAKKLRKEGCIGNDLKILPGYKLRANDSGTLTLILESRCDFYHVAL